MNWLKLACLYENVPLNIHCDPIYHMFLKRFVNFFFFYKEKFLLCSWIITIYDYDQNENQLLMPMHTCVRVCACMCFCTQIMHTRSFTYVHVLIYVHTFIDTFIYVCMRVYKFFVPTLGIHQYSIKWLILFDNVRSLKIHNKRNSHCTKVGC